MKIKNIKDYRDKYESVVYAKNSEREVSNERAAELIGRGYAISAEKEKKAEK